MFTPSRSFSSRLLIAALFGALALSTCFAGNDQSGAAAVRDRLDEPGMREAILGALAYIEDRQVRNRPGKGDLLCDSTDEGDGSGRDICVNLPFREMIELPMPSKFPASNRTGEWASHVHFLPKKTGFKGRTIASVQDSNMFITVFVSHPLFLYDDRGLPSGRAFLRPMLDLAYRNVGMYERDGSFNFWPVLPGVRGKTSRSGPVNLQVGMLEKLGNAYVNPKFDGFFKLLSKGLKVPPKDWLFQCLDTKGNPSGADALFNIPNDADDTSTAVAMQALYARRYPDAKARVALEALSRLPAFRDLDRAREDGRDGWKGRSSGAYLTWLKDENEPIFGTPETGIIPLGVNNVDAVVNANVAFSLALNGLKSTPGYDEALRLLARAIEQHAWPAAGLYYPQNMIFPYTATRAYRDGGAREGPMREAMKRLLTSLLDEQDAWARVQTKHVGAFPGGEDRSDHVSTGLGLISLLNIGRPLAAEAGELARYDRGVRMAVQYLLKTAEDVRFLNPGSRRVFGDRVKAKTWDSGLFFAASFWDLGHWRSQAFTVAVALEALTKYALGYDDGIQSFGEKRIGLWADQNDRLGVALHRLRGEDLRP